MTLHEKINSTLGTVWPICVVFDYIIFTLLNFGIIVTILNKIKNKLSCAGMPFANGGSELVIRMLAWNDIITIKRLLLNRI